MTPKLVIADKSHIPTLIDFIVKMQNELNELKVDQEILEKNVMKAFDQPVTWILFVAETGEAFGCCYLEESYTYWREEKRFYLGGFYILPQYRGKGRFIEVNKQLDEWVKKNNGYQVFCRINEENSRSQKAFIASGMKELDDYKTFYKML